jgi:hypothetical protein
MAAVPWRSAGTASKAMTLAAPLAVSLFSSFGVVDRRQPIAREALADPERD